MGNRYQAQSNFDITSFRHQLISSSFSSSRSNCDVTSFPRKQISQNFIMGTDRPTDQRTNGLTDQPTNLVSYRGATSRLKNKNGQPLPGAKQFRRNQFSTSADFLFLLLFLKQLQRTVVTSF